MKYIDAGDKSSLY